MLSRSRAAFTLLELMVSLVVFAILVALAAPTYMSLLKKAQISSALSEARALGREASTLAAFRGEGPNLTDILEASKDLPLISEDLHSISVVDGETFDTNGTYPDRDIVLRVNSREIDVLLTFSGSSIEAVEYKP